MKTDAAEHQVELMSHFMVSLESCCAFQGTSTDLRTPAGVSPIQSSVVSPLTASSTGLLTPYSFLITEVGEGIQTGSPRIQKRSRRRNISCKLGLLVGYVILLLFPGLY